ncbi:hypothetical protein [Brevundimonas sp. DC300-4]|uniref:hypothetical protein n=1 Tax=Brevundimonas sp. DC300-4 TaxID=2804594 RepID=UPI003CEC2633
MLTNDGAIQPSTFGTLSDAERHDLAGKFDLTAEQLELVVNETDMIAAKWICSDEIESLYRADDVQKVLAGALVFTKSLQDVDPSRRFALLDSLKTLNPDWDKPDNWPNEKQRRELEKTKKLGRNSSVSERSSLAVDSLIQAWTDATHRDAGQGENGMSALNFFRTLFPLMRLRGPRSLFTTVRVDVPLERLQSFAEVMDKEFIKAVDRRRSAKANS